MLTRFSAPSSVSIEAEVPSLAEPRPGVFFPRSVELKGWDTNNRPISASTTLFSDLDLEEPRADLMAIGRLFVPNCKVWVKLNRQSYRIDANGQKVEVAFEEFVPMQLIPRTPYATTSPTSPSETAWYNLLLVVSTFTFVIGLVWFVVQTRKRSALKAD